MDSTYLMFALPALALSFLAQIYVKSTFSKYAKVDAKTGMTGLDAAKKIRDEEKFPVGIQTSQQALGDYFDPSNNTIALSADNVQSESVANIAVVAHEMGHAQQKFTSSAIYGARRVLVKATPIGTNIGYILFFVGLATSMIGIAQLGLQLLS